MIDIEVLIIGGGPAAITIAKNISNRKKVALIRPEDYSMIYCAMPYVIENIIPFDKSLKKDAIVTNTGAVLIRDKAIEVDFESKSVVTAKGDCYTYEKLVIATGAVPLLPPIEGSSLKGVFTFKTEDDLKSLLAYRDAGIKKAVVVGAGAIGIELAQALNNAKIETYLIDMKSHVLPQMMDIEMVKDTQDTLKNSGIHLILGDRVRALKGERAVSGVVLENGKEISFNADGSDSEEGVVVFAVGMKPEIDLFKDTDLSVEKDGIIVNEKMETNIKDVYAVGDCVQFKSGISGNVIGGKLATNAVPMGKIAAKNILGDTREYRGFFNGAATKIEHYFIGGTGFTEKKSRENFSVVTGYAEFTTAFPVMPFAKKVRMKLIADKDSLRVLGGQVVGGEPVTDKVDLITMAVQYGIKVSDLVHFSYSAQPYQSFFPANNLMVACAEEILQKVKNVS